MGSVPRGIRWKQQRSEESIAAIPAKQCWVVFETQHLALNEPLFLLTAGDHSLIRIRPSVVGIFCRKHHMKTSFLYRIHDSFVGRRSVRHDHVELALADRAQVRRVDFRKVEPDRKEWLALRRKILAVDAQRNCMGHR